jgi:hypothetical protein
MIGHLIRTTALILSVATVSCSSPNSETRGVVSVDGKRIDTGTIHFRSEDDASVKGIGAVVTNGEFGLGDALTPGVYRVAVEGFRSTGRVVADPQRGQVPETVQLQIQDLPVRVEISASSEQVRIELKSASK